MMDATKYHVGYYPPPVEPGHVYEWTKKDHIEKAPAWCSVDLRDGNQSLIVPMSLDEKLEFYDMLIKIGFKEIEVGFPAASETEYEFLRKLIDGNRIPQDVTVQVLTQCRDHIIRKTFEAVKGAPRAIIHFYNSTSVAQREQVFKKSKEEIKQIAVDGAKLVKQLSEEYEGNFLFEYSPESFTGTEVDYAVEVCNAVLDIMQPTPERPMIINLPVTVEMSMPHVYAVILILMLLVTIMTYVIPAGTYARVDGNVDPNSFTYVEQTPVSFLSFFTSLHQGFVESANVIGAVLLISGAIQIIQKTGAFSAGIQALIKRAKGRDNKSLAKFADQLRKVLEKWDE